jgi:choline dehydrogenase-like flavoprotein
MRLKGIGAEFATVLYLEGLFRHFENRRQLAAYAGLAPSPWKSGSMFGMPLAKIVHSYDKDAEAVWNANFDEGLKIAKATGAKDMWSARGSMPTIHLIGGTIMGTEAGNSVVNSYGQTHEIPNLYVAGPGIFVTSGASNPTYTIFALSLRGAEQLAASWGTVTD